jgi:hypothetical protein
VKKSTAVRKAAKTPTAATLKKEITADTRREATLKHDARRAGTTAVSRKHDLARAAKLGKTVRSLKHELALKTAAKKRTWSPDSDVACCSARAVAESLRLALGVRLAQDDVLGLHRAAGGDRDSGASILDVLWAAQASGLAEGYRLGCLGHDGLAGFDGERLIEPDDAGFGSGWLAGMEAQLYGTVGQPQHGRAVIARTPGRSHSVIVGLDLPWGEPHAVTYDPRDATLWSWGEPCNWNDFPGAVIEECWAVAWS